MAEIAVAADRQRGEVERAIASRDVDEAAVIPGVAREEQAPIGRGDHPRGPEPRVLVVQQQRAAGRVLGRHRGHREGADAPGLPPVQLDDAADAERLEPRAQAERHEERRMMRPRQPRHGAEIEVVRQNVFESELGIDIDRSDREPQRHVRIDEVRVVVIIKPIG